MFIPGVFYNKDCWIKEWLLFLAFNDVLVNLCINTSQVELDALRLQLEEKHKQDLEQLRCSMALSYREELLQARSELTDRYYSDMEQLKTKHALEIEQLRAKLSDSHLKGEIMHAS